MKVEYAEQFLKDLKNLKHATIYESLCTVCFEDVPRYENLFAINHLKKLQGHKSYYRIKIGNYRIGIKDEGHAIVFMRVLHRKDIYRVFPHS